MTKPMTDFALELEKLREEIQAAHDPNKPCITVCAGTGCCASGALDVARRPGKSGSGTRAGCRCEI